MEIKQNVKQWLSHGRRYTKAVALTAITLSAPAQAAPILTEVLADPASGLAGDANGDGVRSASEDEFLEFFNDSAAPLDLSGVSLSDGVSVRHQFAQGTSLGAFQSLVVFGGGQPTTAPTGSLYLTASTGSLGLNNGGDVIELSGGGFGTLRWSFGNELGHDESLTLTSTGDYVGHSQVSNQAFSPGTKPGGSAYGGQSQAVPEPASIGLLGLSLLLFAGCRRMAA